MSCPNCISGSLSNGKYICTTEDYRVVDSSDDLVWVIVTHNIPNDEEEINSSDNIKYCICKHWEM
tara:strand:- start:577 stop:771 length:195 start_codon:yes stop_codon:yes gene_type:complete